MKKISIIIPVYNTAKYLKRCLDSVLAQSYKDFEMVIINDGSTDNSEQIINEYKDKYPDLISYYNKKDLKFEKNDNIYYSRLLFKDDKLGVIDVTNDSDECFVKVTYNYATIETKVNLLDLNETISNIMIILSSINYNDAVIKNILTNESKVEDDEVVEVFDNKKNDNSSLDVEEDEYSGNEEEDYDPDVIN